MIIRDLTISDHGQAERLIAEGFVGTGSEEMVSRAGIDRTIETVTAPGCIARVAVEGERICGLIGGLPCYHGHAFELHPLVVHPEERGRGIGRGLVADLEREAAKRGAVMIWLGADDENARTSIGGIDLYPEPLAKLRAIQDLRGHSFAFDRRVGFTVVGCLPDANGFGKPDIFMAKRIRSNERVCSAPER